MSGLIITPLIIFRLPLFLLIKIQSAAYFPQIARLPPLYFNTVALYAWYLSHDLIRTASYYRLDSR